MKEDFLDWLDGQDDPDDRTAEGWMCNTIDRAEGAARRLRAARDKIAGIDATADRIIRDAEAWRAEASDRYATIVSTESKNLETFLRGQIKEGGAKSASLPWGVAVAARKTGGTLDLSNLDPTDAPDAIVESTPKIVAAKAKAYYHIVSPDGEIVLKPKEGVQYTVIDPNGEVVEGVTVKPVEDRFEVKA